MKSLNWGIRDIIPDDAVACWGARTILRNQAIDIVPDRQALEATGNDKTTFTDWLTATGVPWLRAKARSHKARKKKDKDHLKGDEETIYANEDRVHALDDGRFHLRANAQASYGYVYVAAWMDGQEAA